MNSQGDILLRKFLQVKEVVSFLSSVELFGLPQKGSVNVLLGLVGKKSN